MRNKSECFRRECGVTFVLFAILLFAIVGFLALAIDVFILSSSKSQHHHTTEQAALGAMQVYLDAQKNGDTASACLTKAAQRASSIVGNASDTWLGSSQFVDTTDTQNDVGTSDSPGANGTVTPGRWYFEGTDCSTAPASGSCACAGGAFVGSCFETVDTSTRATAIKIDLKLTSPIKNSLGKMLGSPTSGPTKSSAIASQIPRRGVFLIDLSPSIVEDTHKRNETPVLVNPTDEEYQYSFYPNPNKNCECASVKKLICNGGVDEYSRTSGDPSKLWDGYFHKWDQGLSDSWPYIRSIGEVRGGDTNQTKHYVKDYKCCDGEFFGTDDNRNVPDYVLDVYSDPQPLNDVLSGIHQAMDSFTLRSVSGDQLGIIGFDDELLRSRASFECKNGSCKNIGTDWDYSMFNSDATSDQYRRFFNATDTTSTMRVNDRLDSNSDGEIDVWLFPRSVASTQYVTRSIFSPKTSTVPSYVNSYAPRPHTDLPLALNTAAGLFDVSQRSENFVVLFSDGLTNCASDMLASTTFPTIGGTVVKQEISSRCWPNDLLFNASMTQVRNVIDNSFVKNKISLHVVLIGNAVSPHTLVYRNDAACMSDSTARTLSKPFVNIPTTGAGSSYNDAIFLGPNALWSEVKKTSGFWIPVRKACVSGTDKTSDFDAICAGAGTNNALVPKTAFNSSVFSSYVDSSSRLSCDVKGRSVADQVHDAVNDIMKRNPYILVK